MTDQPSGEFLVRMQELLARGEDVHIKPGGISMLPLFRPNEDIIILSPLPEKLKKYDIPFYRRSSGKFVLHRIVKVGESYTCIGDNQFHPEPGIAREQMIGVVTGFIRNDRKHTVNEFGYKLYSRVWHHTRKIRHVFKWPRYYLRRILSWLKLKP